MFRQWPSGIVLREWQQQFLDKYNSHNAVNFLLVATPGAGKTIASLRVIHELLNSGIIERVVIVCPTDHLRTQWLEDATRIGIDLDKVQVGGWSGQLAVTADYVGVVTTYAQVDSKKEHLRLWCQRKKTLVVLDEIHHCGDKETLSWGVGIQHAFEFATKRLLLSGTPFRSDNNPIPFVEYVTDPNDSRQRVSKGNYNYLYGDALRDEDVVRHVVFPSWDGQLVWHNFGEKKAATFKDILNQQESRDRLRTAIHPHGEWIKNVIKAANQKLDDIREVEGHKNAGGLIVAQDQAAATELARQLELLTGEKCTLAISDAEDASAAISKFRNSNQKWIVAVKMVSEGVDIKRLRLGVFATNIMTRTFFRQVIGRVIRWDSKWNDLPDQTAWFYIPEDPVLIALAKEIKTEVTDVIKLQEEDDAKKRAEAEANGLTQTTQMEFNSYEFTSSEGEESHHVYSGEILSQDEMLSARKVFDLFPGFERVPNAALALAWRRLSLKDENTPLGTDATKQVVPKYMQKQTLQSLIKRKTGRLVRVCQVEGIMIPGRNPYATINIAWGRSNNYSQSSTNDELETKLTWLEGLIKRVLNGDRSVGNIFR